MISGSESFDSVTPTVHPFLARCHADIFLIHSWSFLYSSFCFCRWHKVDCGHVAEVLEWCRTLVAETAKYSVCSQGLSLQWCSAQIQTGFSNLSEVFYSWHDDSHLILRFACMVICAVVLAHCQLTQHDGTYIILCTERCIHIIVRMYIWYVYILQLWTVSTVWQNLGSTWLGLASRHLSSLSSVKSVFGRRRHNALLELLSWIDPPLLAVNDRTQIFQCRSIAKKKIV